MTDEELLDDIRRAGTYRDWIVPEIREPQLLIKKMEMSCEVDKFTKEILNYCKLHPGPESDYHIKCIEDSEARRKEILKSGDVSLGHLKTTRKRRIWMDEDFYRCNKCGEV
jgi:hypothetical protein